AGKAGSLSGYSYPRPTRNALAPVQGRHIGLSARVVRGETYQYANAANPLRLLRAPGERPRCGRADCDDEFSASHSMTSSASASSSGATDKSRAFAVLRLITNSNFVGCWTGRSAGLAPARIRPT